MPIVTNEECESWLNIDSDDWLLPTIRKMVESAVHRYLRWHCVRATYTRYYPKTERGGDAVVFGNWGGVSGTGGVSRVLMLDHKWVIPSGLVVQVDTAGRMDQNPDADYASGQLTVGEDYYLDLDDDNVSKTGHLVRVGQVWPKTRGSVKVKYTSGFTTDEFHGDDETNSDASPIRLATLLAVQKSYTEVIDNRPGGSGNTKPGGALTSETVPHYSYTIDAASAQMLSGMTMDLPNESKQLLEPFRRYAVPV